MRVRAWGPLFALLALLAAGLTGMALQYSEYDQDQPAKTEKGYRPATETVIQAAPDKADKKGKDEKSWTDPLLVLFNGMLTLFTWLLYRATQGLFTETAGLRSAADKQSRDMQDSIAVARQSAEAAQKSVEIAERALNSTERAFVFMKYMYASPIYGVGNAINGWDFHVVWENSGSTPSQSIVKIKNSMSKDRLQ